MSTYPIQPVILNVKLRSAIPSPTLQNPPTSMQQYTYDSVEMQYSFDEAEWHSIGADQMNEKQHLSPTRGIGILNPEGVMQLHTRMKYGAEFTGPVRTFGLWWASTDSGDNGCVFYLEELVSPSNPNPVPQILATPQDPHTAENLGLALCFYLDYLGNDLDNVQNQTVIVGELMIDP